MNPYRDLPDFHFWKRAVSEIAVQDFDPVIGSPFKIARTDKVATAGSCFAQHIGKEISKSGFNYYVAEEAHPLVPTEFHREYSYGIFSARYGNIYTVRQLLQLLRRAYGDFTPHDEYWLGRDGEYLDPFRPNIQPGGFVSLRDLRLDREFHLTRVRELFENLDYFIFTLGLTEGWENKEDLAAFPVCPAVVSDAASLDKYRFINYSLDAVRLDLFEFIRHIRTVNRRAKVILTVSPVPLIATYEETHVMSATTYSKSVLRVAAEEASKSLPEVVYFPSFEIITGNYNRGAYFANDVRSVTVAGVSHVMRIFFRHFTSSSETTPRTEYSVDLRQQQNREFEHVSVALNQALCDEEMLDPGVV